MEKDRMCAMVEDLLPSYLEGLTNDTTNQMIEEHINGCEKCRKYKENLLVSYKQLEREEVDKTKGFQKVLSRYRYQLLGLFLGMALTVAAVVGSVLSAGFYFKAQNNRKSHTEDVEEYREFEEYNGLSKLYLFPKAAIKKDEDVTIQKYLYDCYGNKIFQTCQIYLECVYSKEDYEAEKKRLMEVSDRDTELSARYTTEDFPYPAVYAMKGSDSGYEYVLFVEEEQKMIYVFLQGGVDRRDLQFSEEYLPLDYGQNGFHDEEDEYNIYPVVDPFIEEE